MNRKLVTSLLMCAVAGTLSILHSLLQTTQMYSSMVRHFSQ